MAIGSDFPEQDDQQFQVFVRHFLQFLFYSVLSKISENTKKNHSLLKENAAQTQSLLPPGPPLRLSSICHGLLEWTRSGFGENFRVS